MKCHICNQGFYADELVIPLASHVECFPDGTNGHARPIGHAHLACFFGKAQALERLGNAAAWARRVGLPTNTEGDR